MNLIKKLSLNFALIGTLMLGACSTASDNTYEHGIYDPWEKYNRGVLAFNEGVDYVLLDPITKGYRLIVPGAFRTALSNFLFNLKHPVYFINEVLQGDWEDAGLVTKRFVFNTFTGFGGIVDTASWEGMNYEGEDFGQTLAVWGVDSGPYMVLPLWGPSSLRDSSGMVVDLFIDPVDWYLASQDKLDVEIARIVATGLVTKEELLDLQESLRENSTDYYASLRSIWAQRRYSLIHDGEAYGFEDDYDDYE